MPHRTVNGTVLNSEYGNSPQITRIAGNGNGGLNLDFTQETIDEIMSKPPASPDNTFGKLVLTNDELQKARELLASGRSGIIGEDPHDIPNRNRIPRTSPKSKTKRNPESVV